MLKKDLQESIQFPGFYHVPEMETVLIDTSGIVIELITMFCPLPKYNPESNNSYPHVNLPGSLTHHIHRLLARTFLKCPGDPLEMHVNHKDGVKSNNSLDNLEWVEPSENCKHAYMTGLRTDNRPVLLKDLRTGVVVRFYSLSECARRLGTDAANVCNYLNRDDLVPFDFFYTLTYEGVDWKPLTTAHIGRRLKNHPRSVVVSWDDGTLDIYISAKHVASDLGLTLAAVVKSCAGRGVVEGRGFSLMYADQFYGDFTLANRVPKPPKEPGVARGKRKPVAIVVTDTTTGSKEWWESTEEFSKTVGMSKNAIQKSIGLKGRWKHYVIEYCNEVDDCLAEE